MIGVSLREIARRGLGAAMRATVLGLVLALSPLPADAQSYVCNDLTAKLAALSRRPPTQGDRWATAVVEQKRAIAANSAAQARCAGPFDARCAAIHERGRQMAANLAMLERQHARMGGTSSAAANEQARIRALMAQLRCGEKRAPGEGPIVAKFDGTRSRVTINGATPGEGGVTYRIAKPGEMPPGVGDAPPRRQENRSFFSMLFGGNSAGDPDPDDPGQEQVIDPATAQMLSGNYRTLCVRTCDGYYFPISFNASQGRLRTDVNVCKALCPAAETRLYYHANPGQEAEQAVAADSTGDPLTKLPNAFRYRTEVVAGCTCGSPDPRLLPPGAGGLKGSREARGLQTEELPLPPVRPLPDEDPETQAVTVAGLVVEPVSPPPPPEATLADATDAPIAPHKVRRVGPKYFSDR